MITIRRATVADSKRLLEIYSYYVKNTAITFEYDVPTLEEFKLRIEKIGEEYPYLVALDNDVICGYAYAHAFNEREAYKWCVETSIYLDKAYRGNGIGTALYKSLEVELNKQNIIKLIACITVCEEESEYLSNGSVYFHASMGYKKCAYIKNAGYKFNSWWSVVWLEKNMSSLSCCTPKPFIPYKEVIKVQQ